MLAVYACVAVFLVLMAGLMSGLTLGCVQFAFYSSLVLCKYRPRVPLMQADVPGHGGVGGGGYSSAQRAWLSCSCSACLWQLHSMNTASCCLALQNAGLETQWYTRGEAMCRHHHACGCSCSGQLACMLACFMVWRTVLWQPPNSGGRAEKLRGELCGSGMGACTLLCVCVCVNGGVCVYHHTSFTVTSYYRHTHVHIHMHTHTPFAYVRIRDRSSRTSTSS